MDSWRSSLLVTLVWALLFLPGLAGREFKGEEPRRAIVAREMIETGDWLQPRIAGERYEAKPPLFNWLIAGSWAVGGRQNEALARLPSALAMLGLALAALLVMRRLVDGQAGLITALLLLLNPAALDKGWLAEIDPFYTACYGVSLLFWLWGRRRLGWWRRGLWAVSGAAAGLGMLAKGPVPLLWFLLPFFFVEPWREWLLRRREQRQQIEAQGVALPQLRLGGAAWLRLIVGSGWWWFVAAMLAVGLPWYLWALGAGANESSQAQGSMAETWRHELMVRAEGGWNPLRLLKVPLEGVINFLPWSLLLLPLIWRRWRGKFQWGEQRGAFIQHWSWALVVAFVPVALLPGSNGRYLMPLIVPAAVLVAVIYGSSSAWQALPRLRRGWVLALRLLVPLAWAALALVLVASLLWRSESMGAELLVLALGAVVMLLANKLVRRLGEVQRWSPLLTVTALVTAGLVAAYCAARVRLLPAQPVLRQMAARLDEGRASEQAVHLYRFNFTGDEGWLFYLRAPRVNWPERAQVPNTGGTQAVTLVTSQERWLKDRAFLENRLGPVRELRLLRARPEMKRAWVRLAFGPKQPVRSWAARTRDQQRQIWLEGTTQEAVEAVAGSKAAVEAEEETVAVAVGGTNLKVGAEGSSQDNAGLPGEVAQAVLQSAVVGVPLQVGAAAVPLAIPAGEP